MGKVLQFDRLVLDGVGDGGWFGRDVAVDEWGMAIAIGTDRTRWIQ